MLFLGMDTSTSCGSIALADAGQLHAEWNLNVSKTHAGRLLPDVERLLSETGMGLEHVDGFAVACGPGSFTGLRIGLTTAKALALATDKPLVGIPTLDLLVANVHYAQGLVCPVLDARKGQVFTALYRRGSGGETDRLTDYRSVAPEAAAAEIREPVLFVGDGIHKYGERLKEATCRQVRFAPTEYNYPRASTLCRLAIRSHAVEGPIHPRDLKALYVRASDAELNRQKNKAASPTP